MLKKTSKAIKILHSPDYVLTQQLQNVSMINEPLYGFSTNLEITEILETFDSECLRLNKEVNNNDKNQIIIAIKLYLEEYFCNYMKDKKINYLKANQDFMRLDLTMYFTAWFESLRYKHLLLEEIFNNNFVELFDCEKNIIKEIINDSYKFQEKLDIMIHYFNNLSNNKIEFQQKKKVPDIYLENFVLNMMKIYEKYFGYVKGKRTQEDNESDSDFGLFCKAFFKIIEPNIREVYKQTHGKCNTSFFTHLRSVVRRLTESKNKKNKL